MIKIENIVAGYGKDEVLHGVSLTVRAGEINTLIGKNGCGKSTLLKTISGFIDTTEGDIFFDKKSVKELSRTEKARLIAYLPQSKSIPDISVGRLVLHGRFPYLNYPRKYGRKDIEIAQAAMESMNIEGLAKKQMTELSGGMRQKVYIAMALTQEAQIIIMDEPTTYLDIGEQMRFMNIIKSLSKNGKTVILVLHDILYALQVSDKIAVMNDGRIITCSTPDEIIKGNALSDIYGVKVERINTESGVHYYYN